MLRLDGWRGSNRTACPQCPLTRSNSPSVRCDDCWGNETVCVECCLQKHVEHPYHRVKVSRPLLEAYFMLMQSGQQWNGAYFQRTTLQKLGLVVQIGHKRYEQCPHPYPAPRSFLVLHTNGFHPITLQFCQCNDAHRAGSRYEQLLRAELFPSTTTDPSTCCSFRMLEQFHFLTLQSKITAYDYYTTLAKLTDNTLADRPYVRRDSPSLV